MAIMEGCLIKNLISPKGIWVWLQIHKYSGAITFGMMQPKYRCSVIIHSAKANTAYHHKYLIPTVKLAD